MSEFAIKVVATYRTVFYCAFIVSMTLNYLVYTGKLGRNACANYVSNDVYANDEPKPVVLRKGR